MRRYGLGWATLAATTVATTLIAQTPPPKPYLPIGLFFGRIEEGARIFTPARLLAFDHPEALGAILEAPALHMETRTPEDGFLTSTGLRTLAGRDAVMAPRGERFDLRPNER